MSKTLPSRDESVHQGRPKGIPTVHVQRMLDAWDSTKLAHPGLSNSALISLVSESIFGRRLNASVRKRDRERLTRTLQRYGRLRR